MVSKQKSSATALVYSTLLDIITLFVSFAVSLNLLRFFRISSENKHGIENISSFIPESGYPIILSIALSTVLIFLLLKKIRSRSSPFFRLAIISLVLLSYFIGVLAPSFAFYEGNIDTFHHGEQLAPALAFEQGKTPYSDLFVLHGAGEDIITPWLSFQLFGESIGSYYLLTALLQLAGAGLFIFLVHRLFKKDHEFLLVVLWFFLGVYAAFYYIRDIPVWIALILVYSLFTQPSYRVQKLVGLGALSSLTLFYSFDRGSFLTVLSIMVFVVLVAFNQTAKGFVFDAKGILRRAKLALPGPIGYLSGLLVALILLGFGGFIDFIKMSYQMASYQGAIFNQPYPAFTSSTFFYWLPILTLAALLLVLVRDIYRERKAISLPLLLEVITFIFGILFLRAATGRPDAGHIAYGSVILFLLFFIVISRRIQQIIDTKVHEKKLLAIKQYAPVLLVTILLFSPTIVSYFRLAEMNQAPLKSTKLLLRAPSVNDSFWTNDRTELVTDYIKNITKDTDTLFVFSSEPLFYYTTKLKNPTNFSISWFADAQPLEDQLLQSLKDSPPNVIIYESGQGFNDMPDYVTMKDRLPSVNRWILTNYDFNETIAGVTILTQK